jgi:LmbE family N-acetylglucosaminyl deacetylase
MNLLGFKNVLCLSPHPDDVEYSMSGTIKKYKDTTFYVCIMTNGTQSDTTSSDKRIKESLEFWDVINLPNVEVIYMGVDINFDNTLESEWVGHIESNFNLADFDCVFATSVRFRLSL